MHRIEIVDAFLNLNDIHRIDRQKIVNFYSNFTILQFEFKINSIQTKIIFSENFKFNNHTRHNKNIELSKNLVVLI